jgi:hypothetical protein
VLQLFIVMTGSGLQAAGHKETILANRRRPVN